jgi:quercetin 2,3-dioxygenase
MIAVFPAESRYSAKSDWLQSSFSFSFGPYYDPQNTSFGPMRVLNDDYVAPGRGFGAHPHSDMEVVSIVLQGKLKHQDNLGNVGVTSWGAIQRMTAGTGIVHTEFNASTDETLNLLQMWFMPEQKGLEPSYEITNFDVDSLNGQLVPVVSKQPSEHVAKIHQDLTIYLTALEPGQSVDFDTNVNRKVFLFVIEGKLTVNKNTELGTRDSARVTEESHLKLTASTNTRLMLIDLP